MSQNLSDAILLTGALSRFYKPKAFEYFNGVRKFINSGFDISKAIYIAGSSFVLGEKKLAKEILMEALESDYSFDEWYSILDAVNLNIGDENLTNVILQKCVDTIKQDDEDRRKKFKMLSDFARDYMNDIKLSSELNKRSK